jgi:hypothetical protein
MDITRVRESIPRALTTDRAICETRSKNINRIRLSCDVLAAAAFLNRSQAEGIIIVSLILSFWA